MTAIQTFKSLKGITDRSTLHSRTKSLVNEKAYNQAARVRYILDTNPNVKEFDISIRKGLNAAKHKVIAKKHTKVLTEKSEKGTQLKFRLNGMHLLKTSR